MNKGSKETSHIQNSDQNRKVVAAPDSFASDSQLGGFLWKQKTQRSFLNLFVLLPTAGILFLFCILMMSLNGLILTIYIMGSIFITITSLFLLCPIIFVSIGCAVGVITLGMISNLTFKLSRFIFLTARNFLLRLLNKVKGRRGVKTSKATSS